MKTGGYKLQDFQACTLPQPVASAFTKLFGNLEGASYKPVLYCATQLANGFNHLILCEITKITNPPIKSLETVVINIPAEDIGGGKATHVLYEPKVIVEEELPN